MINNFSLVLSGSTNTQIEKIENVTQNTYNQVSFYNDLNSKTWF